MNIDKTKISGVQFMLLIACFMQASGLLTTFISMVLKQDSWLTVIFASVIMIPLILLYKVLITRFPKQNLFQIFEIVFGKVFGKIFSFIVLFYFVVITILNMSDLADFTKLTIMDKTPDIVLIGVCILVGAFTIRYGIKAISRFAPVFLTFSMFVLLVTCILLLEQFNFSNFFPMFVQEPIRYVQGTHLLITIPLGEFVMFLMFTKNVEMKKKQWNKYLFAGIYLGIFLLLIVKVRDIALLGNIYHMLALPQLISLKLVSLGDALSRMEVLFAVVLILLLYFKITLLMYVTLISICQLFEIEKYWKMIPIMSVMLLTLSNVFIGYNSEIHLAIGRQTVPFTWTLFEHIIPFLTLLIAILTRKSTSQTFGLTKGYLKGEGIKKFQKIKFKSVIQKEEI